MEDKEFNLLDEKWIRVMDESCNVKEVSLKEALLNAHEYKALAGELPTQDIVILRLMLAVMHTVFSRVDVDGNEVELDYDDDALDLWESIWEKGKLPTKPIEDYLEKWYDSFWLFHPKKPFWQVVDLPPDIKDKNVQNLNGEILQSDHKERLFLTYTEKYKNSLSYAQAARWLMACQGFADKAPRKPVRPENYGWLAEIGALYIEGQTLFETLMLNFVVVNEENNYLQKPCWEEKEIHMQANKEISMPNTIAGLYTFYSRQILLIPDKKDKCVKIFKIIAGEYFQKTNAFLEPMTAWKLTKNKFEPKKNTSETQLWREFSALFMQEQNAGVIKWNKTLCSENMLEKNYNIKIKIIGINFTNGTAVNHVFSDSLAMNASILSKMGKNLRKKINDEVSNCEKLSKKIGKLAKAIYVASGGSTKNWKKAGDSAKSELYFRLDLPFRNWLISIDPNNIDEVQQKQDEWQKTAKEIARKYAEELASNVADTAFMGHMVSGKFYSVSKSLNIFYGEVNKIYKKI